MLNYTDRDFRLDQDGIENMQIASDSGFSPSSTSTDVLVDKDFRMSSEYRNRSFHPQQDGHGF